MGMREVKSRLRLYIDSSDRADWEQYLPTGLFYGVTTNPAEPDGHALHGGESGGFGADRV
jgi:hypothetical protein